MKKKNIFLLILIFIALFSLIAINYCSIKIISATRAYINGESEYSKGQKDALLYLSTYIQTRDSAYWGYFNESIKIPLSDNLAKQIVLSNGPDSVAIRYFVTGNNNLKDIPGMICLFRTFKASLLKKPIELWTDAEPLINQTYSIALDINDKIGNSTLTEDDKQKTEKQLSLITAELSKKESAFSRSLSYEDRLINKYLIYANIFLLLLIVGGIGLYAIKMIRRLMYTNQVLEAKNSDLIVTNSELDAFVYSVSHDLRSPITSIKGLINVLKEEDDVKTIKDYVGIIDDVISKQDVFILEILDYFKNKRLTLSFRHFSLKSLIEGIIENHKYSPLARDIVVNMDIGIDEILTDELRVKMILNNLISNAIKYSDEQKPVKIINIKTYSGAGQYILEIEDNGIGIDNKYIDRIYDMFFVTSNTNKGTGLGLYILKQNIEKLNGRVEVESELNIGTKFTIRIPSTG